MHVYLQHLKKHLKKKYSQAVFIFILFLAIILRWYHLDELPSDTFGDQVENIEHVQAVLNGDWRLIYGFDGREGLYFYIAAISSFFLGNTYFNLKCVTAVVGILTIISSYFLTKHLTDEKHALLVAFFIAVSKWPLVYSRIGFRTVFTPLLVSLVLLFLFKSLKNKKIADFCFTAFFLGLGLYTYTAFKFMVVSVILMLPFILWKKGKPSFQTIKKLLIALGVFILVALPQTIDAIKHPDLYMSHPGPMILENGKLPSDIVKKFATNILHQAEMLHLRGDVVFRINPTREPMLDVLSGMFFLVGVVVIGIYYRKLEFFLVSIVFFVMQLPSVLVLNFPDDVPSATRTTAIIPIVFLITALGLGVLLRVKKHAFLFGIPVILFCFAITILNVDAYFNRYKIGLPNKNIAFDKVIAAYIDRLPHDTLVYVAGGSWGDAGQPHPRAIIYSLKEKREITLINENFTSGLCERLKLPENRDFFIVLNPNMEAVAQETCVIHAHKETIKTEFGDKVFIAVSSSPLL